MSVKGELKEYQDLYVEIKRTISNRKNKNRISTTKRIEFLSDQYDFLLLIFDNAHHSDDIKWTEQWVTKELVEYLIPSLNELLESDDILDNELNFAYKTWEKAYALASRRSFHHFLLFVEMDRAKDKQVYSNRIEVLRGMSYYLNKMDNEELFLNLVASFPPSYGKSFIVNYFSAWIFGQDLSNSILRMSYSDDLLNGFSRSIKELILGERFMQAFPEFARFGNKPFAKEQEAGWRIKTSDSQVSHYSRTRDGAVTGVRANSYIAFDDMTKGQEEANNDTIHENYWQSYMTAWQNRKTDDKVKELTVGTMWNPKDILGRKGEQLQKKWTERKGKFPYCTEYVDDEGNVRGVIIRVPLLDENEKSTCETIYTTETALEIRENTDDFLFSCVYQQDPIAPTGRAFSYENLQTYKFLGSDIVRNDKVIDLNKYARASLDPVRKGKDYISMPICRYDEERPFEHYLVDVIYRGKSMDEVYDGIVEKVIQHNIVKFVLENNTDTSLKYVIEQKLKNKGYYSCELVEKFNTKNKLLRIKDADYTMRTQIIYPEKGIYAPNTEMGKFMQCINIFSYDSANKNDDAPDSVALYVDEIIKEGYRGAKVEAMKRPSYI